MKTVQTTHRRGMVGLIVSVIVAIVMIVAAAIPVTTSVISSANLTGTTSTIVNLIPLFLGIAGLMVVVALIRK